MLDQATLKPEPKNKKATACNCENQTKEKCKFEKIRAIYKNRKELDQIIMPEVERYEKRNISTKEAGIINQKEDERRAKEADEKMAKSRRSGRDLT